MSSQLLIGQSSPVLEVWVRLLRGNAATRRALSAQLHAEHELTINDFECLLLLAHAEENSLRRVDLAEGLQLTASGVTRLLDGLEHCGLVAKAKCDTDARVTYAVLTDEGRRKLEAAAPAHMAQVHALFTERYTAEELGVLAELLSRLPGAATVDQGTCTP
ncbi:MAG TPA: MarR family transcriptional regulator [Solirubrobacteraceae bacterium]|jgi:DNA-binding MarR family transcriptional regulator|nr:MarR family transcriptional regulator [Solirubrobacteraceae bacterium]